VHQLLYTEKQHMLGAALIAGLAIVVLVLVLFRMRRTTRLTRILSIAVLIVGAAIVTLLSTLRLETRYYAHAVEYQFGSLFMAPFEVVSLDSVASASVITYDPSDYGGWGVKGNVDTRVYNASGNQGILFTFKSGKRLLLGTQHPDSLKAALRGHYPMVNR
jgi:hypothetical protein